MRIITSIYDNSKNTNEHVATIVDDENDNYPGWTKLMLACEKNDSDVIKNLIDSGEDVNFSDKNGATPLIIACIHSKNPKVIVTLLEAGAKVNIVDSGDFSPLMHAVYHQNSDIAECFFDILMKHGADPSVKSKHGHDVLLLAKVKNHSSIVRKLTNVNANSP